MTYPCELEVRDMQVCTSAEAAAFFGSLCLQLGESSGAGAQISLLAAAALSLHVPSNLPHGSRILDCDSGSWNAHASYHTVYTLLSPALKTFVSRALEHWCSTWFEFLCCLQRRAYDTQEAPDSLKNMARFPLSDYLVMYRRSQFN